MYKFATAALAVALGISLSAIPAMSADDKTMKEKAVDAKDTVKEKTSEAWDKTKEKTSEAWDKTKEKTIEAKDKVKAKVSGNKKEKISSKAENSDVRQAQTALKEKGIDPGPIDGIHGPRTTAALRSYQKAENIKVTGRLDAETKSHLMGQASGSTSPTTTPSASPAVEKPVTAEKPSTAPSAGGSPSAPPTPASKTQKP